MVKSEPLAIAVAAEWDSQKEKIERSRMHLVSRSFQLLSGKLFAYFIIK